MRKEDRLERNAALLDAYVKTCRKCGEPTITMIDKPCATCYACIDKVVA